MSPSMASKIVLIRHVTLLRKQWQGISFSRSKKNLTRVTTHLSYVGLSSSSVEDGDSIAFSQRDQIGLVIRGWKIKGAWLGVINCIKDRNAVDASKCSRLIIS